MSGIASIGTATNSNLAGAGPSINITGRADLTTISMFSNSDSDLKNGQHDIKRHEICLSVPQRQIQAYSQRAPPKAPQSALEGPGGPRRGGGAG